MLRLTSSKFNYWLSLLCDVALCAWLLMYVIRTGQFFSHHWAAALFLGVVMGTFFEYSWHRWLFHNPKFPGYSAHMQHHGDAESAAAMPFFVAPAMIALLIFILMQFVPLAEAFIFCAGVMGQYSCYGFLHHADHHLRKSPLLRRQAYHTIHHRLPDRNFGVTNSLWDRVFGTYYKQPQFRAASRGQSRGPAELT